MDEKIVIDYARLKQAAENLKQVYVDVIVPALNTEPGETSITRQQFLDFVSLLMTIRGINQLFHSHLGINLATEDDIYETMWAAFAEDVVDRFVPLATQYMEDDQ